MLGWNRGGAEETMRSNELESLEVYNLLISKATCSWQIAGSATATSNLKDHKEKSTRRTQAEECCKEMNLCFASV